MNDAVTGAGDLRPGRAARAALISGIIALFFAIHDAVTAINAARPPGAIHDLSLPVDGRIPYLAWTWVIYYFGDLYILIWGSIVVWKMPSRQFTRAVIAYAVMILIGAGVHLALPGRSPWPDDGSVVQHWFHEVVTNDRNVCLPSMHVAFALLSACMTFHVFRSRSAGVVALVLTVLISASTLTLKEHYALDVAAGALLALAVYAAWKVSDGTPPRHTPGNGASHDPQSV